MDELIQSEDIAGFSKLVTSGADINLQDANGKTLLDKALSSQKFLIAAVILNSPSLNIHLKDKWGRGAIHFAAMVDAPEQIIRNILQKGADVNLAASDGRTPLHYAASEGSYKAMELLFSFPDINVNAFNNNKQTALHLAIQEGKDASVKILVGHPQIAVDQRDILGNTPLMDAAKKGFVRIVTILLESHANPKLRNFTSFSALDFARENKQEVITQMLIAHGADPDLPVVTSENFATARRYNNEGNEHLKQNKFEQAREEFIQAIKVDPFMANPYFNLSLITLNLDHDYKKTEELLHKAIELHPEFPLHYYHLGRLLQKLNRMPEAIENFKRFVSLEPDKQNEGVKEVVAEFSLK